MKCLMALALAAAFAATADIAAANPVTPIAMNCDAGPAQAGGEAPNLHGHWDFLMVPRGTPSFGLMSIGFVGADYGGSLAPVRTAPVVLRNITWTATTSTWSSPPARAMSCSTACSRPRATLCAEP